MNWRSKEFQSIEELSPYYFEQGFFYEYFGTMQKYRRDFSELRSRDLALFTLGNIEGKEILDLGCGVGLYSITFLKMGAKYVYGQDISDFAVKKITERVEQEKFQNFKVVKGDGGSLDYEDNKFDVVFCGDVVEHITDEKKMEFIKEAFRVLKPGGVFTIKTPNIDYLRFTNFLRRIKAVLTFKNPFNIHIAHTKDNPDNEHHGLINHKDMVELFNQTMFHNPIIVKSELDKNIPRWLSKMLGRFRMFNQNVIISVRKPIFYGVYG